MKWKWIKDSKGMKCLRKSINKRERKESKKINNQS